MMPPSVPPEARQTFRSSRSPARSRRPWLPAAIEALAGRALLAASVLDPTLDGGQPIVTPADGTAAPAPETASAVAVPSDGKVVVLDLIDPVGGTGSQELAVRRHNADSSIDATFGTAGEAEVAIPASLHAVTPSSHVLIQPDGGIVSAGTFSTMDGDSTVPLEEEVCRLGAAGPQDIGTLFGPAGAGASIPAPGRYLGASETSFALDLPSSGTFAVLGGNEGSNEAVPFGAAGVGASGRRSPLPATTTGAAGTTSPCTCRRPPRSSSR